LEQFTYTVSHDLKSPLITIKGFLGYLEKDALAGDSEQTKHDIARINGAVDKMANLLNDLLELSRIGRMINAPQALRLGDLAREAVSLVAGQIAQRGVQLEIASDLPLIYGDRLRLLEMLQNLIDNGVKFMGDQPAPLIEIGVRQEDGEPVYYVRDNGIGIEPRYHERIFGLFERLKADNNGTGVGLALVKRIVELHDGRIWVESEGEGKGSTFCFTLPARP
jgi:signal transduction histidine kinase